jgi:hypothetical protein
VARAAPRELIREDSETDSDPYFVRMVDIMLPHGGYVAIQIETYFDESGSHDGSRVLCVAGYVFEKTQAIRFTRKWKKVLSRFGLPYFHMVDCAHGNGVFANLKPSQRVAVEKAMIKLIQENVRQGLAVTIDAKEFKEVMPYHPSIGTPYSFCCHLIIAGVAGVIDANPSIGKCGYFFEAGHQSMSEANRIMTELFAHPEAKSRQRYAGHAFVSKEDAPAVQAADLLAWQWYKDRNRQLDGRPRRKDCAALLKGQHTNAIHLDRDRIAELANTLGLESPNADIMERLHIGDPA